MEKQSIKYSQFQHFTVIQQLGKGSFGTIYKAKYQKDQQHDNKFYAIKVQTIGAFKPMLHIQYDILSKLKFKQLQLPTQNKGFSIPQTLLFKQQDYFSYMAMELLDITLEDFSNKQMKNIFSKDCLIKVFYNVLKIIEFIHKQGYVHRDIKSANFMLKLNPLYIQNSETLSKQKYLPTIFPIDLGLCKNYINPITRQHISFKQNKKMVGTALFCSLNTHKGFQQSRRDDIQAIVYMVTYFVKKLPWESACNKETPKLINQAESPRKRKLQQKQKLDKYEQIHRIKNSTNFEQLFKDQNLLPSCFFEIYKISKLLQFQEEPNYSYLYSLLQKQHYQLTNKQLSVDEFQCSWQNLSVLNKLQNNNKEVSNDTKKKIKINFKIPPNKLKKPLIQIKQYETQNIHDLMPESMQNK